MCFLILRTPHTAAVAVKLCPDSFFRNRQPPPLQCGDLKPLKTSQNILSYIKKLM